MAVHEFECESCIHVSHKEIWNSIVGEHLTCERETLDPTDRHVYAMAVFMKDSVIIGHLPRVLLDQANDL